MRFRAWHLIALGGGILYGISDEIHQIFVYGRGCQLSDMCFDALGVVLGTLVVAGVALARRTKIENTYKSSN